MDSISWQHVLIVAAATDLATGLGALPFILVKNVSARWQGIMSALAGGMMISAAVFSLADKALNRGSAWQVVLGMLVGALFFFYTAKVLENKNWQIGDLGAEASRKSILILVAMIIHSIPEGVAVGVGYATGELGFGVLLAIAIAIHNIPEGIAISLPLRARSVSVWACFWYSVLSSLPQPIFAVPAFLLVSVFHPLLPASLGFAGGAMIYLVVSELIPDSLDNSSRSEAAWATLVGLVIMLWITSSLHV